MKARQLTALATTTLIITLTATHASADEPNKERPMVNPALWGAGLTLAAVGGVATVVGGVTAWVGSRVCFGGVCDQTDADIGIALVVSGLSAATLGGVFVLIGGRRRVVDVAFAPAANAHGGGLSFVGRF